MLYIHIYCIHTYTHMLYIHIYQSHTYGISYTLIHICTRVMYTHILYTHMHICYTYTHIPCTDIWYEHRLYTHMLCTTYYIHTHIYDIYTYKQNAHTQRARVWNISFSVDSARKSWIFHNSMRINASPSDSVTRTAPLSRCSLTSLRPLTGRWEAVFISFLSPSPRAAVLWFSGLVPISVSRGIFKSPPTPINTASQGRGLGTGAF